jgi:hypothetical protein
MNENKLTTMPEIRQACAGVEWHPLFALIVIMQKPTELVEEFIYGHCNNPLMEEPAPICSVPALCVRCPPL